MDSLVIEEVKNESKYKTLEEYISRRDSLKYACMVIRLLKVLELMFFFSEDSLAVFILSES